MLRQPKDRSLIGRTLFVASIGGLALSCPVARAADYEMVVSGPLVSAISESSTFDGTNYGTLPPVLDIAALEGGSFSATFRFSTVIPIAGNFALYDLLPPAGMTFDLFNSSGGLVHHGGDPSEAIAIVQNDIGTAPYTVDQVFFAANVNSITGAVYPVPLYGPPTDLISVGDLSFAGYVSPGVNYLTDLSIPIDPATYLGFPFRAFDVFIEFGDGDYVDQVGPFQLIDTIVQYEINSLTVTAVPEAGVVSLLIPVVSAVALRRHRAARRQTVQLVGS